MAATAPSPRGLVRRTKDGALALATRAALNARLRGIVRLEEVRFDTARRALHVRGQLEGELAPFEVDIPRYHLRRSGEATLLTIERATASRAWLTTLLERFVVGQSIELLPPADTTGQRLLGKALRTLL